MRVRELIELLRLENPEAPVLIATSVVRPWGEVIDVQSSVMTVQRQSCPIPDVIKVLIAGETLS